MFSCLKLPYKLLFFLQWGSPAVCICLCPKVNCASREVENGSLILAIKNKLYVIDYDVQIYLSHLELILKWRVLNC